MQAVSRPVGSDDPQKRAGLSLDDRGVGTRLEIDASCPVRNANIRVSGRNNTIIVHRDALLENAHLTIESDDNLVEIGRYAKFRGRVSQKVASGNVFRLGPRSTIGHVNVVNGEGTTIEVGADCMLAYDVELRSTDSHAIFDLATNRRLNTGGDIRIADRVWIGAHCSILRGTMIGAGSIVGVRSVVRGDLSEEHVLIAGSPGKVRRRGVRWERPLLG